MRMYECTKEFKATLFDKNELERIKIEIGSIWFVAQKLSDVCIVTSDNPRTEDPQLIIEDILKGLDKNKENYRVVVDRREAIKEAIEMAQKDDIVIIAGKGHENYQILGKVKHHFDDKEIAQEFLNNK